MTILLLMVSMVLLLVAAYTGHKDRVDRWEGALMLLAFGTYYYFLFRQF